MTEREIVEYKLSEFYKKNSILSDKKNYSEIIDRIFSLKSLNIKLSEVITKFQEDCFFHRKIDTRKEILRKFDDMYDFIHCLTKLNIDDIYIYVESGELILYTCDLIKFFNNVFSKWIKLTKYINNNSKIYFEVGVDGEIVLYFLL